MDEILEEIDSKIEENQYYLDNFEFINDKTKIINEALVFFNNNKAEAAVEKLYNITRYDLIKLFVLCTRFFDSKEEHEKLTDFISFLMHDGKNRDFKKKKFDILFRLLLLVSGEKRMIINEETKKQLDLLKKAFIQIYEEDDYILFKKVAEVVDFALLFYSAYNYFDILNFDYKGINIPRRVDFLRNFSLVNAFDKYVDDRMERVFYSIINLDALDSYLLEQADKCRKEIRSLRKENTKLITKAQKLRELSKKKDKEIISIKDLKDVLDDSQESFRILNSLAKSNSNLVLKMEESFGKKEQVIYELYNHHYNYDEVANDLENDINSIDIDILKENLNRLSKIGVAISNKNLVYIIKSNLLINEERIKPFISKNYINSNIINKNIRILVKDEDFLNYSNNIKLLEKFNINVLDLVGSYYEFLLINNDFLEDLFNLAEFYKLKLDSNNILLLIDTLNFDNIDLFVEEGYSEFIVNNLNLLSKGDIIPKRIHINNLVNSELVESSYIDEDILNEGDFFISDRQLDDACSSKTYLFQSEEIKKYLDNSIRITVSDELLNSDIVLKLDSKYRNGNVYDFDGVIISRNKVLRNLEALSKSSYSIFDKVLNSVIYNSLLGIDDLKTVKSEIKNTFGTFKTLK